MSGNIPGPSNAPTLTIPSIVFFAVCPVVVAARLWCRLRTRGGLGADDHLAVAALVFAIASGIVTVAACHYGYGQHAANLTKDNKIEALKFWYISQITYKTCINLTKASILCMYIRIFGNIRWLRHSAFALVAVVTMYWLACIIATIFQCTPVSYAFDKSITGGTCINSKEFWYANAGFSIATDVIILALPMPLVYRLQIPVIQKVALMGVFLLGSFVLITSILRLTTLDMQAQAKDQTFHVTSTMWTTIEMNIAVVCVCLPQLRPLIAMLFPKFASAITSSRNKSKITSHATGFNKSVVLSTPGNEDSHWARADAREGGINMTNIRKADTSSEEYILQEDGPMQIHKTVEYNVSYSKD